MRKFIVGMLCILFFATPVMASGFSVSMSKFAYTTMLMRQYGTNKSTAYSIVYNVLEKKNMPKEDKEALFILFFGIIDVAWNTPIFKTKEEKEKVARVFQKIVKKAIEKNERQL